MPRATQARWHRERHLLALPKPAWSRRVPMRLFAKCTAPGTVPTPRNSRNCTPWCHRITGQLWRATRKHKKPLNPSCKRLQIAQERGARNSVLLKQELWRIRHERRKSPPNRPCCPTQGKPKLTDFRLEETAVPTPS